MKRQITDWGEIFVRHRSDKRTGIQNMQRTLNPTTKETHSPSKNGEKDMNRHLLEKIEMDNKHVKDVQHHLSLGELQIKTTG